MDIRKIKKLIEMLQESDLTEIEVGQGDESVRITRGGASQFVAATPISNQTISNIPSKLYPKKYMDSLCWFNFYFNCCYSINHRRISRFRNFKY